MEIKVPLKYAEIFQGLPQTIYKFRVEGEKLVITMPIGYTIPRDATGMKSGTFRQFFRDIEVSGAGYKRWKKDRIDVDNKRTIRLSIRVSPETLGWIKKIADARGFDVTNYIIGTVTERAIEDLKVLKAIEEKSATRG